MRTEHTEARRQDNIIPIRTEVEIRQSRRVCWSYTWDREKAQLRLHGIDAGKAILPADLAMLTLEGQADIPVAVLAEQSIAPGTLVSVRLLGAFQVDQDAEDVNAFPLVHTLLLAEPDLPGYLPCYETLEQVPPPWWHLLQEYARTQFCGEMARQEQLVVRSAAEVEQLLRAARFWLKRARRQETRHTPKRSQRDEEQTVAWRVVEALTPGQHRQMEQARTREELAALLQPAHLIRFVPTRFQQALQQLLLEDEQLLAFLERPLLRHRTGLLGLQQYRANAGLLVLTDRQLLWLRDFFSPGSSAFPEGYLARSLPLARLVHVQLVPAGVASPRNAPGAVDEASSYLRLTLDVESTTGCEQLGIAFPADANSEQALTRILPLLLAFVPGGTPCERRVRCLPTIEAWMPRGEEARRLNGLGGIMSPASKQRLEQQLAETLAASGEALLASALVPALEQYRTPARLVALTRIAVLVCEDPGEGARRLFAPVQGFPPALQRYPLAQISSAQLSYSLFGSDVRLFVPEVSGETREVLIPFQSPALAWFLPLFTRLRLALTLPSC